MRANLQNCSGFSLRTTSQAAGRSALAATRAIISAMSCGCARARTCCLFNGRHGEWLARIAALEKKIVHLDLVEETRPPSRRHRTSSMPLRPIKAGRLDYLVQKAVEDGGRRAAAGPDPITPSSPRSTRAGWKPMRWKRPNNAGSWRCRRCVTW